MDSIKPVTFALEDLDSMVRLNELRAAERTTEREHLEKVFSKTYGSEMLLAVYGSLAPGRSNHHQLSNLEGAWHYGYSVNGRLEQQGWGAHLGFPALHWSPTAAHIPIQLFVSKDLPKHWARLDEFEGDEYLRILVPVKFGRTVVTVANLYAVRRPQEPDPPM